MPKGLSREGSPLWAKVIRAGFEREAGLAPVEGWKESWSHSQPSITSPLNALSASWEAEGGRVGAIVVHVGATLWPWVNLVQLRASRWVSEGSTSSLWKAHRCWKPYVLTQKAAWKVSHPIGGASELATVRIPLSWIRLDFIISMLCNFSHCLSDRSL